ncbi:hypothetical protein CIPAW_04G029200 [Carya illinoinensis]|uniref:Cytochrome P450 n=2 Tax=Carya illinoinensis TaxID=32201 RepID=A0A8T1QPL7_CARIL|nr:hypothetical protein CIPAW_04G029200 [Carya illinoinensis]
MALLWHPEILVSFLICFLFLLLLRWRWNKHSPIINWPVLQHSGGTIMFKGPWFSSMNFVFTSDPNNIHHILNRNFSNYEKGPKFREIFEPLGNGIFNSDSDSWKSQRKLVHSLMKNSKFDMFLKKVVHEEVEMALIPVLDHVSSLGIEVNLQDVFQRLTFDIICNTVLVFHPNFLSVEFPELAHASAFDQMEQGVLYRHIVPESYWKLQRWLQMGEEKKLGNAWRTFDQFLYHSISSRREELRQSKTQKTEEAKFDLLTAYMAHEEEGTLKLDGFPNSNEFLRDTVFNLMVAGRDSVSAGLTWFLWLIATHPAVEAKILEEIRDNLAANSNENRRIFCIDELSKLVYLHGAICESLRLFPPLPLEHLNSVHSYILPSGLYIDSSTRLLYSLYSMGRMESIWGEDFLEFKPERWISEQGRTVHVPSYKFTVFNAGPRTCLGKEMALIQMKMVASAIIWNYHVQVVQGHPILPSISVVLHMKHGLKVKISKRSII